MIYRYSPDRITNLKENEIFVFGSNLAGIHGAGAAKLALQKFGAILYQGVGLQGKSYAIPTKDQKIQTLSLDQISGYVDDFIAFAKANSHLIFLVSAIGCGLAGYKEEQVAPLFKQVKDEHISNILLPKSFANIIEKI